MSKKTLQQYKLGEKRQKANQSRWHAENREHRRGQALLRNFGITLEQYDEILKSQNGTCAICKGPESIIDKRTGEVMRLSVDHDHKTGRVRGLLCRLCNSAIGKFNDDPELILKAIQYLGGNA